MNSRHPEGIYKNDRGAILATVLVMIAVLVLLGVTAIMTTTTDLKISGNYREESKALSNAEAGVEFFIDYMRIDANAENKTIHYPTTNGGTYTVTITPPPGFSFNSSVTITCVDAATGLYKYQMTGTAANNASKTIEMFFTRTKILPQTVDGAVAIYGNGPILALKTGGGSSKSVDGHNYPVPANANCSGSACRTSPSATGAMPGLYTPLLTPAVTGNLGNLDGVPPQKVGGGMLSEQIWADFVNEVLGDPARYQANILGTRNNPRITVVENGSSLTGNRNGAGLIIVKDGGSFVLGGNTYFEGVIVLMGSGAVATATGTAIVLGSVVTINHPSKTISAQGSTDLYYSSQAVANIRNMDNLQRIKRQSWRTVS